MIKVLFEIENCNDCPFFESSRNWNAGLFSEKKYKGYCKKWKRDLGEYENIVEVPEDCLSRVYDGGTKTVKVTEGSSDELIIYTEIRPSIENYSWDENFTLESFLITDLGFDELDMCNFFIEIENMYKISITEEEAYSCYQIKDVVKLILKKLNDNIS